MMTVIYALLDPNDLSVRYVGKAKDLQVRYCRHCAESGKTPRHQWIRDLLDNKQRPEVRVLEECDDSDWAKREQYWIAHFRQLSTLLLNRCSGGNGAPGISPSAETRAKISAATKATWDAHHSRQLSPELRARLLAASTGRKNTPETIAKRVATRRKTAETVGIRPYTRSGKPRKSHGPHSAVTRGKIAVRLKGEHNGQAKLTWEQVREIRARYKARRVTLAMLGNEYGVDMSLIGKIVRGELWIE